MQNKSAFENLPKEVILIIFSLLPAKDLLRLSLVNRFLKELSLSDSLWKSQCKQINVPKWKRSFYVGNFKTCYREHKGFHITNENNRYYVVGELIKNTVYSFSEFRRYEREDISTQEVENSFPRIKNKIQVFRNLDDAKYYAQQKNDTRYLGIDACIAPVFEIKIKSGLTVKETQTKLKYSNMEVVCFELVPSHIEIVIQAFFKGLTIGISQNYENSYSCVLV